MKVTRRRARLLRDAAVVLTVSCPLLLNASPSHAEGGSVSVVATGLNNPRGLHFGPDGQLYVAEGGRGGTSMNTIGQCQQVPVAGPYTSGGNSASVSRVNTQSGAVTRIATNLPSSQTSLNLGGLVSGVADVAFVHGVLYAMISGAGCSHGLAGTDNAIVRINADGTVNQLVDLSEFLKTHPVANPEPSTPPGDFEPDGTWYGMAVLGDSLYALEPNSQQMDRVDTPDGEISRVVDFSTTFVAPGDWRGPTSIVRSGGAFYASTLTPFPITPGAAQILKVTPGGHFESVAGGLTTVLGVAVDAGGRLYALEMSNAHGFPTPGTGDVVRVNTDGSHQTIASGLSLPTAMTLGPDGNLYISNQGFGFPPGAGEIVKITIG